MDSIGDRYHEYTKIRRGARGAHKLEVSKGRGVFRLPEPVTEGGMGLWECIARRRSFREYSPIPLSLSELSQLLWATQGITEPYFRLRAAPSAGALYPLETYVVVNLAEGLERGVYRYLVEEHALEMRLKGDLRQSIASAALEQEFLADAGAVFIWTAVPERTKSRYGERGWRYIYKDAAHACANLYLAAVALGLGCCAIGACFDDEVNWLLGIDGVRETVVYLASVGRRLR